MLTQKQQALIIIALSNVAMASAKMHGMSRNAIEAVETFKDALISVRPTAEILTDEEMITLAAEATREIMAMRVSDIKITPDSVSVPLQ